MLANALIQQGVAILSQGGAAAADLIEGLDDAEEAMVEALATRARPSRRTAPAAIRRDNCRDR
ncbi:protein of unknown function (plasmid) [Methylocella tundrae]|uniref:Uncharacterized protein n=1 Tax=Methylocella tundrae TaxID=227605 RepID=A0A4U8Z6U8_METTU|nr:protein of unknown function [Methylocella tundrae]